MATKTPQELTYECRVALQNAYLKVELMITGLEECQKAFKDDGPPDSNKLKEAIRILEGLTSQTKPVDTLVDDFHTRALSLLSSYSA